MKKPFVVEIEETYRRTVVLYAEDSDEAFETAEELCNNDEIEFTAQHFSSRICTCAGEANEADLRGYDQFDASGMISTPPEDSKEGLMEHAKELIAAFCEHAYKDENDADFPDLSAIPVAYTDFEDEDDEKAGIRVEVFVDLNAGKINTYMNGHLVSSRGSDDFEEFVGDLEYCLDFDDLVTITEEEMEVYKAAIAADKKPDLAK